MQLKKSISLFLALTGLLFFTQACNQSESEVTSNSGENTTETTAPEPIDPLAQYDLEKAEVFTDTARILAGMTLTDESSLAEIQKTQAWLNNHNFFESKWSDLDNRQYSKVRAWSDTELKEFQDNQTPLFYPFSGPDFLYAYKLFPQAKEYVMVALDPVGTIPSFEGLSPEETNQKLYSARKSLEAILNWSFFRTLDLDVDLAEQGVIPILYLFLARTNNQILDVQYIALNPEAKIETIDLETKTEIEDKRKQICRDNGVKLDACNYNPAIIPADDVVLGVQIDFLPEGEETPRKLYYFSNNLDNNGIEGRPQFSQFIQELSADKMVTYLKAASYLMHLDSFSDVQDLILTESDHVLQDDSGMPLRAFDPEMWEFQLYGTYTSPIALFQGNTQSDLRQKYQTDDSVKPLDFGIGYKYQVGTSNLMLTTKKAQ